MENSIIVYKSITVANRAKRLLEKENIKVNIVQLPQSFNIKGCNYAVKLKRSDFTAAMALSEKYRLKVRGAFEDGGEGV